MHLGLRLEIAVIDFGNRKCAVRKITDIRISSSPD
jgi:hypothetical protein